VGRQALVSGCIPFSRASVMGEANWRTISRKTPCAELMPGVSVVCTVRMSPGTMTPATAAAQMPAIICAGNRIRPRTGGTEPVTTMASVTAGLNSPPEMRKSVHTVTSSERPYDMAM